MLRNMIEKKKKQYRNKNHNNERFIGPSSGKYESRQYFREKKNLIEGIRQDDEMN